MIVLLRSCISIMTSQGINSLADSESPLKWTKTALQSDLSDFSFEPVVLTTGGLLQLDWKKFLIRFNDLVETLHVTSLQLEINFKANFKADFNAIDGLQSKQKQTGDPSMLQSDPWLRLPTGEELPDSDDTPVDNELQNEIPNLLKLILGFVWATRNDWFLGVDMGVYHTTGTNPRIPLVPDGFLSLGVPRLKRGKLRKSYVVWEENDIVPILNLEIVSHIYGDEYDDKMDKYARLGVLYYVIYNPEFWQRDKHDAFEVYRLVDGVYSNPKSFVNTCRGSAPVPTPSIGATTGGLPLPHSSEHFTTHLGLLYQRQTGEPVWMPEIGLAIGRGMGIYCGLEREWLYWYDESGNRYPSPEEQAAELRNLLEQYQTRFGNLPNNS